MASSSSSFHSTPLTSWKYDVFLSFRGTDTRNTIVDHLYSALVQQGIDTFKDDQELPRGETIRPSLLNAIEGSQIAVVVFSENYADSSWCLQELEHIMKCKDERRQIVIPIFYRIDPSEVRKQEKKYGEAFAQYEAEKKDVESWRKALSDAGNLSGLVAEGPETIFIKEIVSTVSKRLCVPISSDDEDLVGIKDRLQALKSMLAIDSQGVLMVGIWGLGGGGKTTLASAVYNEISSKFDGCCFLKNVREESSKHGLENLQKEILSCVLKQKKEELYGDVRMLIKSRLRRKKVLLVLDDVDDADQLEALAGSHDWFNEGSRVIITTRDQHLLNIQQVNVICNISLLNDEEALKLFCKHALRRGNCIEDFDILSKKVVSYARGLPLALKVMGSLLSDKDRSEWVSALARLKDIPEDDIMERLKLSYDKLKPLEKKLFLDIACFFRGTTMYYVNPWEILEACGLHPKIGVRTLIEKALITVTEGKFDMHDLIQEMGHYIVRGNNPQNPEKHSRVWRLEDAVKICATPTGASMENHSIEALEVGPTSEVLVPLSFPQAVANMKELRWISCDQFPATSLSRNFQSTRLSYLQLRLSNLKQLWRGDTSIKTTPCATFSSGKLLSGKSLQSHLPVENLVSTPDFQGLPCLERIRLADCSKLKHIHPSISYHEKLVSVDMSRCTSLKTFPPISGMKKLETLILSKCRQLCNFPEIHTNMENMVELSFQGTGIKVVPSSIGQYCINLISLDLSDCRRLKSIECNFHLLKHLKELNLGWCHKLKVLEQGSMKFLGFSPSLRKLSLCCCKWINGDISSLLCELSNLQVLDLSWNDFSRLHCSFLQLRSLKALSLSYCKNLVELPELPESIAVLEALRCDKLKVVDLPTNLRRLWRISLSLKVYRCDVGRKVQSMLQENAIKEDYSISLTFYDAPDMPRGNFTMLELPRNWYNEFSGFLICIHVNWYYKKGVITIKDVMGRENEDVIEVSDGTSHHDWGSIICYIYISFGSLRHTSWWKSKHTTISFSIERHAILKVELVPRRSKGNSTERVKDTTSFSEFFDTEPIKVKRDSESCIEIQWDHGDQVITDLLYS
ncbi:hypothetical protein OSB04_010785 [Centaurea solstitialis]|uniref:TIR domain-containing protein n=1 Tax=Centaurea solstitialis TaxID=347529 RepID=A0AA38TLE4_9ASTR|nr:hypothetical protein OSB04_010785 [Centaurea solstitialis]